MAKLREILWKFWCNASSWIVDMFRPSGTHQYNHCTDEPQKDETCLQFKMEKHYIKSWKISREHIHITIFRAYHLEGGRDAVAPGEGVHRGGGGGVGHGGVARGTVLVWGGAADTVLPLLSKNLSKIISLSFHICQNILTSSKKLSVSKIICFMYKKTWFWKRLAFLNDLVRQRRNHRYCPPVAVKTTYETQHIKPL